MTVTIDPNTGLPELPKRHFWRVPDLNELQIRKRFLFFSYEVWVGVYGSKLIDEADLLERAKVALGYWIQETSPLIGDYPPKKLETA